MADLKRITPQKILWLDLEMTGLIPTRDKIVEVATIVTDWDFKELASFESGVGAEDPDAIRDMLDADPWFAQYPDNKKKFIELAANSPAAEEVEDRLLELVNEHFAHDAPALLAGNSIHMDRQFIRQYWPRLEARLHYRMLDVSAWKVVMLGKYNVEFKKKEAHRALDDVRESIAELQFYLERMS